MKCNNFIASMAAGRFLALAFSDDLLSQMRRHRRSKDSS
jgi:hypothetical protein